MSRAPNTICCVSWFDAGAAVWDPHTLGPTLVSLCHKQPYAPNAVNIDGFVRAGFEASQSGTVGSGGSGGKACLLLETRCAQNGRRVVGAALWSYGGQEAELEYLVVDATWRRQGWGWVLMEISHVYLTELGTCRFVLEVATKNMHAIVLYRALGYLQEGVRHRYYKDGQDALVMVRVSPVRGSA